MRRWGTTWAGAVRSRKGVSSLDQNLSLQENALRAAGCQVIRAEKKSGAGRAGRSELALLLEFLRAGGTLVVIRVDRLVRSLKDLQDVVAELKARGVALRATGAAQRHGNHLGQGVSGHAGGLRRVWDQPAPRAANRKPSPGPRRAGPIADARLPLTRRPCAGWRPRGCRKRASPASSASAAPPFTDSWPQRPPG